MCDCNSTCLPVGPQGETGATGATGPQGPQGDPGADGTDGVVYEHFDAQVVDVSWVDAADTAITNMNHTLTGANGEYAIWVNLLDTYDPDANGTIKLFVSGVEVQSWGPAVQGTISDLIYTTDSFVWRGTVTTGQNIEVKVNKSGAPNISTKQFSWMILRTN